MAVKLPTADALGQRPTPQSGSSVASYRVDDSAEAVGRATMGLGAKLQSEAGQLIQMQEVENKRVDTLRAEDAFTKLREKQLDLTVGKEKGFVNIKGGDAISQPLFDNYSKMFTTEAENISSTLGNDRQKELFMQRAKVAGLQFGEDVLRHTVTQGDAYANQVYEGTVNTEIRAATAHWDEPNSVALSIERVNAAIRTQSQRLGLAPEMEEAKRLEVNGKIHSAIVSQALAEGNYKYAQDWYEQNKADIDKPTAVAVQKAVEDGTQKQLYAGYSANLLANRQSPAGLDALEKQVSEDKTLDVTRQSSLLGRIASRRDVLVTQQRLAEERRLRVVERQITSVQNMTLQGYEATPEQLAPILNAARGTELDGMARQLVQTANATRAFRQADPRSQEQYISQLEAQARKDPTKFDVTMIQRFKTIHENQKREVKEDPTSFAVRQGFVEAGTPATTPLDFTKPEQLGPQLQARLDLARGMQSKYGAPFKPLTTEESGMLASALKGASPPQKLKLFSGLAVSTKGDPEGYKAIMAQLAPDDPVTSIAGILANKDSATAKGSATAALILQGQAILNPPKKEDGSPSATTKVLPPEKDLGNAFRSYERDAFAGYPQARSAYYQTATAIYAAKASAAGDFSQVLDSNRWEESIKLATGGIDKYNGKAVMLPWGQDAGQFRNGLNARLQDAWASGRLAEGMTMSKLRDMPLEMAGDGRYVLKAGDGILVGKDSKPVFIDFNQQPRVPNLGAPPTDKELREAAQPFTGRQAPSKDGLSRLPNPTAEEMARWDKRADGSQKGLGYFGLIGRPDGQYSSEISVGVNLGGKEMEIPTMVPGLTRAEMKHLIDGKDPTPAIIDKAVKHARSRIKDGKSVWAGDGEQKALP